MTGCLGEPGAQSIFVEAHDWRSAGRVIDGHDIEAHRTIRNVPLTQKIMSGADQHLVLVLRDAELGLCGLALDRGADVTELPQAPVGVLLALGANAQRVHCLFIKEGGIGTPQAVVKCPLHRGIRARMILDYFINISL